MDKFKSIRLERSKKLLSLYARNSFKNNLFTDEKIVILEERYNKLNDRVYAESSLDAKEKVSLVQRDHHNAQFMILWGSVSWHGVTSIHFCEKCVKTGPRVYQTSVLDPIVKPLSDTLFEGIDWVFKQDSEAKTTQFLIESNMFCILSMCLIVLPLART